MAIARLQAITQERISFEFDGVSEVQLNSVPPSGVPGGVPYAGFQIRSHFITSAITVSVDIPWHEPIPHNVIIKINNDNFSYEKAKEYREIVIDCNGHSSKVSTSGFIIMYAGIGRPRDGICSDQTVEFILNFGDYLKTLVCPINRTSTFKMCLYKAYAMQGGYLSGSVHPSVFNC